MKFNQGERLVPIEDIVPYDRNPRVHSKEQITLLANHIKDVGFDTPIVVDEDMVIIKGHGRLLALKKLRQRKALVKQVLGLTVSQKKASRIADNKLQSLATDHEDFLKLEMSDLADLEIDLATLGYTHVELDLMDIGLEDEQDSHDSSQDDEIPDVPDNVFGVARGDVWQLGNHRVMCGDSTDRANVDQLMDGTKADMVFTDPPYGMGYINNRKNLVSPKGKWENKPNSFVKVLGDHEDFKPELIEAILALNIKETFIWGADYFIEHIPNRNEGALIVWDKRVLETLDTIQGSMFELCWSKQKHKREIIREKWIGLIGTEQEHDHKRVHPTQKPTNLVIQFFERWGKGKTKVIDLYLGSGSTLIACEKTDRQCYGMEIDPHYCSVIIKRWQDYTGQEAVKL